MVAPGRRVRARTSDRRAPPAIFGPQISSGVNWPKAKRGSTTPSRAASAARRRGLAPRFRLPSLTPLTSRPLHRNRYMECTWIVQAMYDPVSRRKPRLTHDFLVVA